MATESVGIHEAISGNNYDLAYRLAANIEGQIGRSRLPVFLIKGFSYLIATFILVLGSKRLFKITRVIGRICLKDSGTWEQHYGILWGYYWQNMREAFKYNLTSVLLAESESQFNLSIAFLMYTHAFLGSSLPLKALRKWIAVMPNTDLLLRSRLLVWLGVAYQMNSIADMCKATQESIDSNVYEHNPFLKLISKASVLNSAICDLDPSATSVALEDCFRSSIGVDNSRNHIQMYGAKSVLLELVGNRSGSELFLHKSLNAANANNNTLDWIIFNRIAAVRAVIAKDWPLVLHHLQNADDRLKGYAEVLWYQHDLVLIQSILLRYGKISYKLKSIRSPFSFYIRSLFHRQFRRRTIGAILRSSWVTKNREFYWKNSAVVNYLIKYSNDRLLADSSLKLRDSLLTIERIVDNLDANNFETMVEQIGLNFGAIKTWTASSWSDLFNKLPAVVLESLRESNVSDATGSVKTFVDNLGIFVGRRIPNDRGGHFVYGVIFPDFDLHTNEATAYAVDFVINHMIIVRSATEKAKALFQLKSLEAKANMAHQVAHDIRSPLFALDVVMSSANTLPEDKRVLARSAITRIRDIANNLIEQNKVKEKAITTETPARADKSVELIANSLDSLMSEKRMQFRSNLNVELTYQPEASSYGLFAEIQPAEFSRVVSNLINNAVEALPNAKGRVTVLLTQNENRILISVQDNGKGIPGHLLPKLGQRGVSFGKDGSDSGSGLGLAHARETIESFGGELKIESTEGEGTQVQIYLPKAPTPDWFINQLEFTPRGKIAVVDDDSSIHQVWQGRFDSLQVKEKGIEVLHFSTPANLQNWVLQQSNLDDVTFLVDYEFLGYPLNGLEVIKNLKLAKYSVLVTSRYEEPQVASVAKDLGVRMIPKGMAGLVPLMIKADKQKPDAVLIDDDELIHISWQLMAKQKSKEIKLYKSPEEFLSESDTFAKETPIFVDVKLANGVRGETVSKNISDLGFVEVNLATGFDSSDFSHLPWIKSVVGKDFPF